MTDAKIPRCSCEEAECYRKALEDVRFLLDDVPVMDARLIAYRALASVESAEDYAKRTDLERP